MMSFCRDTVDLRSMRIFTALSLRLVFLLLILHSSNLKAESNFCQNHHSDQVIFCLDFQDQKEGQYTSTQLQNDWPNLQSLSNKFTVYNLGVTQKRVAIAEKNDNMMMKIHYPKDRFGPWMTGATWKMYLPGLKAKQSYEHVSLEYKVLFKKGFLYDPPGLFGGKLPGLMGGENMHFRMGKS